MDEIRPEILKALDIVWAVLADTPIQCRVEVGNRTCVVADRGPHFLNRGPECVLELLGNHTALSGLGMSCCPKQRHSSISGSQ